MKKKKYILSVLLFLALFIGTYYFVFKDYSINEFINALSYCNPWFIGLGILGIAAWAFFHALYLKRMLSHLGYKINWYQAFGYVFTECYFSAVTPSSIGGQPVQMIEMSRDGIPYRVNSVVILLNTLIYKLALITYAIIAFLLFYKTLFSFNNVFNWLVILGFITTILLMICFIILIYSKKVMYWIIKIVIMLCRKLPFIKNVDELENKLNKSLKDYQDCAKFTREHPKVLLEAYAILLLQRISILGISYVIYLAFGLEGMSFIEVVAFQICITLGSDFMPFPGGVVVSEGLLLEANKLIYGSSLAPAGMILLRSVSFYIVVLFAFLSYLFFHFKKRKKAIILKEGE